MTRPAVPTESTNSIVEYMITHVPTLCVYRTPHHDEQLPCNSDNTAMPLLEVAAAWLQYYCIREQQ